MKAIQQKYKDDRQKQSEEMMKLYKKHGTNPLASCFPLLAQAPIFFALFTVLNGIAQDVPRGVLTQADVDSAANASFFGAPIAATFLMGTQDIVKLGGSPGTVKAITLVMILLMSASTFITQRQLMTKGMPKLDGQPNMMVQQQKIMLYLFPIIFAVTGINFPVGVLLYWLTTNVWTMGQQLYVIKRNPTPGSPAYFELEAKRAQKNRKNQKTGKDQNESSEDSDGTTNNGSVAMDDPAGANGASGTEAKGQRQQPKRDKGKKSSKNKKRK
jgi:YidC/Oxa1 family membrane protein insertase